MSKNIKTFFTPIPRGIKRKLEPSEQNEGSDEASIDRTAISNLAKIRPALSPNIGKSWFQALEHEFSKDYFEELSTFLEEERKQHIVYPPVKDVYSWTLASNIKEIKVVILGQDPYHGPNQAHGLAFSVCKRVPIPPSLRNIYAELKTDIPGFMPPCHGFLYGWATQGVLLLNACLTVRAGCANSHQGRGWENLTDAVIRWINQNLSNVVFMLWGGYAQNKAKLISSKHLILKAPHPSPLSAHRGFIGCKHFSKANTYLENNGRKIINWNFLP